MMHPAYKSLSIIALFFFFGESQAWASHRLELDELVKNTGQWSLPIQTLMMLTGIVFLPACLLMMTSFTRIIIVLTLLRSAIGVQSTPPNQVLLGLALFMTFFVMSPTCHKVYEDALLPLTEDKIVMEQAIERGMKPFQAFMLKHTRESDIALFTRIASLDNYQTADEIPFRILLPAFVTSELKTAFQIGFTVFIPFLIIDLVVASILMALGMMMVPPSAVALPFKLMLFVLVDGWPLLLGSLAQSFTPSL